MTAFELRRKILGIRDAMEPVLRRERSDAIWKRLVEVEAFQRATQALFYISHGSEVETGVMRRLSRELGMLVAAPRSEPSSRHMRFHVVEEDAGLIPGPFGILQPPPDAPLAVISPECVVLVPGSVYDRGGNRLGFGGGYYDRWLAGDGKGLPTVGLAFREQVVDSVPVGPLDVPVQWLVTDSDTVECGATL